MVAGAVPLRTASKLSVLVVDDDQDIREYLQDFLSAEGFEVTTLADPTLAGAGGTTLAPSRLSYPSGGMHETGA